MLVVGRSLRPALGSMNFENKTNERGERYVWLVPDVVSRLRSLRGEGESYSDVILRIAEAGRAH